MCVHVVRTFKIYFLGHFQVSNKALLTTVIMLYITPSECTCNWSILFDTFTHFPHSPSPWQLPIYALYLWVWSLYFCCCCLFFFFIPHVNESIHYLSFLTYSRSITPSRFTQVVTKQEKFPPFFNGWIIITVHMCACVNVFVCVCRDPLFLIHLSIHRCSFLVFNFYFLIFKK